MPDDMPIGPTADDSSGATQPSAQTDKDARDRVPRAPEGEVRGGSERVPAPPLEQTRREERERGTKR